MRGRDTAWLRRAPRAAATLVFLIAAADKGRIAPGAGEVRYDAAPLHSRLLVPPETCSIGGVFR